MATARTRSKLATRTRVLAAAEHRFRTVGFTGTTVRDIAADCDVSIGTVIATGDKRSLLVQVFDSLISSEQLGSEPGQGDSTARDTAPEDALLSLVQPYIALFRSEPDLAREYASILVSGAHESILFGELSGRLISDFAEVLAREPRCSGPLAGDLARTLYSAYVGTLFIWSATGGDPAPGVLEGAVARGFTSALAGFRSAA